MKIKNRVIEIDGTDGAGKTSVIKYLRQNLESEGVPVYHNKGLGGDGSCEFQNALRVVLLHNKFPKDDLWVEERLFAIADAEGLKMASDWLAANPGGVVLRDRGFASHFVYATQRGMSESKVMECHSGVLKATRELNRRYGVTTVILVPEDIGLAMERIRARQASIGGQVTERLENLEFQTLVASAMREYAVSQTAAEFNTTLLNIAPADTLAEVVHAAALAAFK